jgi:hypothetical protein
LVAEHAFGDDVASHHGIKRMPRNEVVAFSGDLFGILHQLELFVAVVVVQPHALADDFENIDDPKWPIAFMRAQLIAEAVQRPTMKFVATKRPISWTCRGCTASGSGW